MSSDRALFHLLSPLVLIAAPSLSHAATDGATAIRMQTLIDGTGSVRRDVVVVVESGRISTVSDSVPEDAELIDLGDATVIPGLIDVHTHMTYYWDGTPGTNPWGQHLSGRLPAVTVFLAQENARRTLEAGVTTVRDLGATEYSDVALRDLIARDAMDGPRMLVSGHGLHIHYESARPQDAVPYAGIATGKAEVMRVVRQEVFGAGVDQVKMYASTGSAADLSGRQTFTADEIAAAVEAAHGLGVKIAVHSYGPDAARDAVRAGADSIEHAVGLDDETLSEMARKGIFYVPTIDHNRYYAENAEIYGYDSGTVEQLKEFIQRNLDTLRRAHGAGVRIAMGSDALFTMFGQNAAELRWFVKAGMTPEEALATATRNAAELIGLEDEVGAVAPGYHADLVALAGNPLEDIDAAIDGVVWVMRAGKVVVDRRSSTNTD